MSLPVAIVTGGSRGIGRAISERLAADGYAVAVNFVSREEAAAEVVAAIEAAGGIAMSIKGSVAEAEDRLNLVDQVVANYGQIDVLVNNAGITSPGRKDVLELTEESWDQVFATNLKGPFFLSQEVARRMIDFRAAGIISGGKIINLSSISAYAISTNRADYCIAKSALKMMTWLFADRLAEENIQAFEIRPGVIQSDMTAPVKEKYEQLIAEGMTPIRRWGKPEDIAQAVSAICGDAFPFSTGDSFDVDGGFHLRRL